MKCSHCGHPISKRAKLEDWKIRRLKERGDSLDELMKKFGRTKVQIKDSLQRTKSEIFKGDTELRMLTCYMKENRSDLFKAYQVLEKEGYITDTAGRVRKLLSIM